MTISDFVADRRASTPTNAAEIAVPDMAELLRHLQAVDNRLVQAELNLLEREERKLKNLASKRVLTDPMAFLQDRKMQLDYLQQRVAAAARSQVEKEARRFSHLAAKLDAMSPLKVLGRGYAMAQNDEGAVLRSADQVDAGEQIHVRLAEGSLHCIVKDKGER